jgi:hypothetical protein
VVLDIEITQPALSSETKTPFFFPGPSRAAPVDRREQAPLQRHRAASSSLSLHPPRHHRGAMGFLAFALRLARNPSGSERLRTKFRTFFGLDAGLSFYAATIITAYKIPNLHRLFFCSLFTPLAITETSRTFPLRASPRAQPQRFRPIIRTFFRATPARRTKIRALVGLDAGLVLYAAIATTVYKIETSLCLYLLMSAQRRLGGCD